MAEPTKHALRSAEGMAPTAVQRIEHAGLADTLSVLLSVFLPTIAKGVIMRRPLALALAERLDLDRRAVRTMQRLRARYGTGPLELRIPGRSLALVLDPLDARRVLAESPYPFATATPEKRAALAHFEPKMALISAGREREERRRYNDAVLQSDRSVHVLAAHFRKAVHSEATGLVCQVRQQRRLTWNEFSNAWFRLVRRIIFGEIAAEDDELSRMMASLRSRANWAFLLPQRRGLRERLLARIRTYLEAAEPNTLSSAARQIAAGPDAAPENQVPQWLFAFDAAGMAAFRSLALLASQPEQARQAKDEIGREAMPHLRATVLESLRLWPTSPLILRESCAPTTWRGGKMRANTGLVIFTPFFDRDDERLPFANRFAPQIWTDGETGNAEYALIPFSDGPGICPGRHLVLLLTTAMLEELLASGEWNLVRGPQLTAEQDLPGTLNHYRLVFELDQT